MAHILIMPRQGNTVESCIIQEWKVQERDAVKAETTVCVVETDKATFDVPAGADGLVLKILHPGGDDVPVLQPIAVIGKEGEDWNAALGGASGENAAGESSHGRSETQNAVSAGTDRPHSRNIDAVPAVLPSSLSAPGTMGISPRAKKRAIKEGIPPTAIAGSGPGGRTIERDVIAALADRPLLTAAAKAAAAAGSTVPNAGTGMGGRITSADMAGAAAATGAATDTAGTFFPAASDEGGITETPIKGIRKLIADRMHASLAESAQFTLNANASAVQLQELRNWMKNQKQKNEELAKITINDLVLYAVSRVLPSYPYMNAHKIGDLLRTYERVHLGMAVDTPRGLMVPVIRNANLLSLRQISAQAKRLAAACQDGSIKSEELSGSTFTVSNLGSFGITGFTPVLNSPDVAILGICAIELKPVESGDEECTFAYEPHIGFSLTINHQVVDGAPAARFLKALCQAVADIKLTLAIG